MALVVNTNIASLNAQRNLEKSTLALNKSLERLSSGLRINSAGDDAAGMAISTGLQSQINGLNQAVRNANDGLSLIGTAESSISAYTDMLQRIRELAVQSANDTNSASNRASLDQEAQQLLQEMQRIATTVQFNGTNLLDGSFNSKQLQVGAEAHQTITISTGNLQTNAIGMIATATSTALPTTNALGTADLLLNGVDVGPSLPDGVSSINSAGSAIAIANAINAKQASTGVTATAGAATDIGVAAIVGGTFDGSTQQLTINGVDIFSGTTVVGANDNTGALREAINAKVNQTGVTATINSSNELVLTAADGRNINVATAGSIADELGLAAADSDVNTVTGGTISLTSPNDIIVSGNNPGYAGLTATTYSQDPNTAINRLSLGTTEDANQAIDMVDNALAQVNTIDGGLGAITNRLQLTIQNLQAVSENLSAANSRIVDADFASETANLTRNQILQQAGTAILAQANTTTQAALKLLQ